MTLRRPVPQRRGRDGPSVSPVLVLGGRGGVLVRLTVAGVAVRLASPQTRLGGGGQGERVVVAGADAPAARGVRRRLLLLPLVSAEVFSAGNLSSGVCRPWRERRDGLVHVTTFAFCGGLVSGNIVA